MRIGIDQDRMTIPVTAPNEMASNKTAVMVVGRTTLPLLRAGEIEILMLVMVRTDERTDNEGGRQRVDLTVLKMGSSCCVGLNTKQVRVESDLIRRVTIGAMFGPTLSDTLVEWLLLQQWTVVPFCAAVSFSG